MLVVLRLGHRRKRDARVSTHVGLVARAFGADGIIYSGEEDEKLLESVGKTSFNWGGPFAVSYVRNWWKVLKNFRGVKVHLTMYGLPFEKNVGKIRKMDKDVLVVVGSEKVPGEVYRLCDYNLGVTSQPHSEVAALAVFLDRFFAGKELGKNFDGWKIRVTPCARGKLVEKR